MTEQKIDVSRIAGLARIALTDSEAETFQGQLKDIVGYIDKLKEVDVDGIRPELDLPLGPMRQDESRPGIGQEKVIQNAPESAQGQIKVPKVVDPT